MGREGPYLPGGKGVSQPKSTWPGLVNETVHCLHRAPSTLLPRSEIIPSKKNILPKIVTRLKILILTILTIISLERISLVEKFDHRSSSTRSSTSLNRDIIQGSTRFHLRRGAESKWSLATRVASQRGFRYTEPGSSRQGCGE